MLFALFCTIAFLSLTLYVHVDDDVELALTGESVIAAVDESAVSAGADLVVLRWCGGNALAELAVYVNEALFE